MVPVLNHVEKDQGLKPGHAKTMVMETNAVDRHFQLNDKQ